MNQKTTTPTAKTITRNWHVFDAQGQVLGRLSTQIAILLMGKHKTDFVPHLDCGDYVIVVNAQDIKVTGTKLKNKTYYRHSGFPGGLKAITLGKQLDLNPIKVIEWSVAGMLPKNKLRDKRLRRLKVFVGPEHTYADKLKNLNNKTK